MGKKEKSVIAVYAIIFILFNVIYLGIPFTKTKASWIVYVFSLIAIVISLFITRYAFGKGEELKSKFYGFPVFRVGYLYAGIQLAFCLVISLIASKMEVATWIPMIFSIVLMGVAAIGVIATDNARDIIEDVEEQVVRNTRTITYFRLDTENMVAFCQNAELKKQLEKFAEDVRYSDPVSNEKLADIEAQIIENVAELTTMVKENQVAAAKQKLAEVSNQLADRNRRCKALKQM